MLWWLARRRSCQWLVLAVSRSSWGFYTRERLRHIQRFKTKNCHPTDNHLDDIQFTTTLRSPPSSQSP